MPAAEQTWYDVKLLHKVFGASALVLLTATIWMFSSDHAREWKPIQHKANDVEIRLTNWRELQYSTDEAKRREAELTAALATARSQPLSAELLTAFEAQLKSSPSTENISLASVRELAGEIESLAAARPDDSADAKAAAAAKAAKFRASALGELRAIIKQARFVEDSLLGRRKFRSADRDAAVAKHGILLRDNAGEDAMNAKQLEIDGITAELAELTKQYQQAKEHRSKLDGIVKQLTQAEDAAAEALTKNELDLKQLREANDQRASTYINWVGFLPLPGKRFLELPILDAFNSPRKIENNWSNGLEINMNFKNVRRFDRCTTCHQAMQKTLPGSATDPAFEDESLIDFQIALSADESGEEAPAEGDVAKTAEGEKAGGDKAGESKPTSTDDPSRVELLAKLGIRIAEEGLLDPFAPTVQFVQPGSIAAAARAPLNTDTTKKSANEVLKSYLMSAGHADLSQVRPGILVGDVIVAVNGDPVTDPAKAVTRLLDELRAKKGFTITIRRGLPSPYTTHPRLDLFVGSMSPHKVTEFACTICHEGQGSATAFKFASHTPNSEIQRKQWVFDHHWFDNSHWIYPMYPERFAESTCLKCHHQVFELEPSERFPDPPAPKVVHGFHLIRKYGCYGCHEINGYDGQRRVGPDLRLEPNVFAAALQVQADAGFEKLTAEEQSWVRQLVANPERDAVRYRVLEVLEADAKAEQPKLSPTTLAKLTPLFRDIESPGSLRKAGPSLRFAGSKMDSAFLYDWIRNPKNFRPSTRMPQFFGLNKHLAGSPSLHDAEQLEPIEILGLATYLQSRSQKFDYLDPPAGVTEKADSARGKTAFQVRGCLACHNHSAFPDANSYRDAGDIVQGPDLSGVGDKFAGENGRRWLYSWIKEPTRYHARTVMPNLFLDPIRAKTAEGKETVTDPAADIVEFLTVDSKRGWAPAAGTLSKPEDADAQQLDRFVRLNLVEAFAEHRADIYAKQGIPESMRGELKGAETELLVPDSQHADKSAQLTSQQKLMYIGSKTVAKFGCYGCHDIPGFEDSKPIGTVLADWGRKDSAKLAFEHITHYLEHGHGHGPADGHAHAAEGAATPGAAAAESTHAPAVAEIDDGESDADREYYLGLIKSGNRAGFLHQKLREPRSYDFSRTENKKYSERLRMPQFPFNAEEREAVITFVLGLVAEPPGDKYVYRPSGRVKALVDGREVLEKYNCGGCHLLSAEKWNVVFKSGQFGEQSGGKSFPYLQTHFTPQQIADSLKPDRNGLFRAQLRGMPSVGDDGLPRANDSAGDPVTSDGEYTARELELNLDLWEPGLIEGKAFEVGVSPLPITSEMVQKRYGTDGGFLARYLVPHVTELERQVNPAAKGGESWGWLPPPLIGEGDKVQTDWLHGFLLNPYPIRPATFLRMPRFNLSPLEATKLVNYFAAVDNAEYPYSFSDRSQASHLASAESAYQSAHQGAQFDGKPRTRLDDAMRVVVNNNYCVKCHLVGDFEPAGSDRAKAPNLADVYRRLRPEYVRNWVANPKVYLPYTSMPVNIPYDPDAPNLGGIAQELYHGTSVEQVDGLVDLLMNFDQYAKQRSSVATLVKQYGQAATPAAAPGAVPPAASTPPAASGGE